MVNFIYGPSGSGKTKYLLSQVTKSLSNGNKCIILVPEQMTVSLEGYIAKNFDNSSILNLEVLNFSRLCNRIFRTYGSIFYNEATKATRKLIMWKNIRELSPILLVFKNLDSSDYSLAEKMLSEIKELKAYNVSHYDLEKVLEKSDKNSETAKKISDISICYSAYENAIKGIYRDTEDELQSALSILKSNDFFGNYEVFIDSFTSFTALQIDLLKVIFDKSKNTYITIEARKNDKDAIHLVSIFDTVNKLKQNINLNKLNEIELSSVEKYENNELVFLEKNLWNYESKKYNTTPKNISITKCENVYSEMEFVATKINNLIQSGANYNDITIIARDASKYSGIIDFIFEKHNIPYFLSEKTDITTKPLVKFILSALKIADSGFQRQNIISFVKSGLLEIPAEDIDLFCDYVSTWNINGNGFSTIDWTMNPDGFEKTISERGKYILQKANEVKNIVIPKLNKFSTMFSLAKCTKEQCKTIFDFLEELNITSIIKADCKEKMDSGDKKSAFEDAKLYKTILEVLKQLSITLEEDNLSVSEFITSLSIMFSETDIGTIPTSNDTVIIGSASMLRTSNVKYTFCVGLNEGEFPKSLSQSGLISESEKDFLSTCGISLSGGKNIRNSEELYYIYRAFTSPKNSLFLSYPTHEISGQSKRPSIAISRVLSLFDTVPYKFENSKIFDQIDSIDSAIDKVNLLEGNEKTATDEVLKEHGYNSFAEQPITSIINSKMLISEKNINKIFGQEISLSQTKLETFNGCNMKFYLESVLRLRENKKIMFSFLEIGKLVHGILEYFFKSCEENGKINICISEEETDKKIKLAIKRYLDEIIGYQTELSNRTKHLFERIYKLSYLFIDEMKKEFSESKFTPIRFEQDIGFKSSKIKPIEFYLNENTKITIHGIADRIDLYTKDEDSYIRIVDYKTGTKELNVKDIKEGYQTQLLIYLYSIYQSTDINSTKKTLGIETSGKIIPACIEYFSSNYKKSTVAESSSFDDFKNNIEATFKRSGIILDDPDVLNATSKSANESYIFKKSARITLENLKILFEEMQSAIKEIACSMLSGSANASPKMHDGFIPCTFCSMKTVCRNTLKQEVEEDD